MSRKGTTKTADDESKIKKLTDKPEPADRVDKIESIGSSSVQRVKSEIGLTKRTPIILLDKLTTKNIEKYQTDQKSIQQPTNTKSRKSSLKSNSLSNDPGPSTSTRIATGKSESGILEKIPPLSESSILNVDLVDVEKKTLRNTRNLRSSKCDKVFANASHLRDHGSFHSGVKRFECEYCGISFSKLKFLIRHKQKVRSEKNYFRFLNDSKSFDECKPVNEKANNIFKCSYCEKSFPQLCVAIKHERTHGFICTVCNKTFKQRHILRQHERRHTGERPFKCSYCPKAYPALHVTRRHEKKFHKNGEMTLADVDNADKNISCSVCNKICKNRYILRIHERVHTGEKPFKCSFCAKTFQRLYNARRHEKDAHGSVDKTLAEVGNTDKNKNNKENPENETPIKFSQDIAELKTNQNSIQQPTDTKSRKSTLKSNTLSNEPGPSTSISITTGKSHKSFLKSNTLSNDTGPLTSTRIDIGKSGTGKKKPPLSQSSILNVELVDEKKAHKNKKNFKSSKCDNVDGTGKKTLAKVDIARQNEETKSNATFFKCSECEMSFTQSASLKWHKVLHIRQDWSD